MNKNKIRGGRLTTSNLKSNTIFNGVIMHSILQFNGGVSVMPAHIKTRVFGVIPHYANCGYLIHNYITYFIIIVRIINLVKP